MVRPPRPSNLLFRESPWAFVNQMEPLLESQLALLSDAMGATHHRAFPDATSNDSDSVIKDFLTTGKL